MPETLTFQTPARRRDEQAIPVELCGEAFTVKRPKDAVIYFASQVVGSDIGDADRAMAVLQFIDSTLEPVDRKRYFDRVIDRADPVDLRASLDLVGGLLERWNAWPADGQVEPLVVDTAPVSTVGEVINIVNDELELDVDAHPPKDIVLLFVSASMATGANLGQQAWAIGLFLDAALDPGDALIISHRMRHGDDDLDLDHIAEIVQELVNRWAPRRNRAERRAASARRA